MLSSRVWHHALMRLFMKCKEFQMGFRNKLKLIFLEFDNLIAEVLSPNVFAGEDVHNELGWFYVCLALERFEMISDSKNWIELFSIVNQFWLPNCYVLQSYERVVNLRMEYFPRIFRCFENANRINVSSS